MLVSQVVSSSRRNGDSCVEVIEEEEVRVRILASAAPAARRCARTAPSRCGRPSTPATRRATRRNRIDALPAVAGHVRRPHRRGAVLQDDEIDAGGPHQRRRPRSAAPARGSCRRSRRSGTARTPGRRRSETARAPAAADAAGSAARRAAAADSCQHPDDQQRGGRDQQPQYCGSANRTEFEVDACQHLRSYQLSAISYQLISFFRYQVRRLRALS